ncbi:MAG: neutral zinc metallopeptidase [Aerococcaceae bacterium]|nr:neutral zinc metallopeptidase [Aerococcaceae bacterium]
MKTDKMRESRHVEDRRNEQPSFGRQSSGRGFSYGGGGMLPLLLQLLFSRGGSKWILLLVLGYALLNGGGLGNILMSEMGMQTPSQTQTQTQSQSTSQTAKTEESEFVSKVLASTEDFWTEKFREQGMTYHAPKLVLYSGQTATNGCGIGSAAAGPFYCPTDQKIYIDLSFYRELTTKYRASGDFAMAYVIAHEVGHHVQNEVGTLTEYQRTKQRLSETQGNRLTVRLELQADYYAGAWAKYVAGQGLLDIGDIDEAMQAAHAVGDDTLQEQAYGHVVPDSFTHGTSAQRKEWFNRGYQYGDFENGDTFNQNID